MEGITYLRSWDRGLYGQNTSTCVEREWVGLFCRNERQWFAPPGFYIGCIVSGHWDLRGVYAHVYLFIYYGKVRLRFIGEAFSPRLRWLFGRLCSLAVIGQPVEKERCWNQNILRVIWENLGNWSSILVIRLSKKCGWSYISLHHYDCPVGWGSRIHRLHFYRPPTTSVLIWH